MKKIFKFIMLFVVFSLSFFSSYGFELSPIGFDKRIDNEQGYAEFYLDNSTYETQRYRLRILSTGKTNDVSKYVKIYPNIVSVKPQERGIFKIFVEPPKSLKNGVYRFMVNFESIAVPTLKKDRKNIESSISMRVNIALEMEVYMGDIPDNMKLINKKIIQKNGENYFIGKFLNDTKRGYEIGIGFVDSNNSLIEVHSKGRIGKNENLKVNLKIPPRSKKIIFYDYNNQTFLKSSLVL